MRMGATLGLLLQVVTLRTRVGQKTLSTTSTMAAGCKAYKVVHRPNLRIAATLTTSNNGLTVVLTASAAVHIGETYHIKMGLGNAGDWRVPSAVYMEQGSFACGDRFTLTVDDAPNVNTTGTDPILYESDADSIHLRFNRWGGFYLDEHLQVVVGRNALPGVDYLPAL